MRPDLARRLRLRWLALLALAAFLLASCRSLEPATPALRVMSFNVRVPVAADGPDRWEARRPLLVRTLREAQPDLVGTQELVPAQAEAIVAALPGYAWSGRGRSGEADRADDEHMGVFWRRDRLRLLDTGDFWLSDTPDRPGSISWGNLYPRLVSWGLFERIADGRRLYLFNTHLPYRDEDAEARLRAAGLLLARLSDLPGEVPVILTGDFNEDAGGAVHRRLRPALADAWEQARHRDGPEATFHGFTGQGTRRIDWVLSRGLRVRAARTLTTSEAGRYPSDHFPVLVDFDWPAAADSVRP